MGPLDRIHRYLHANAGVRMRDAVDLGVVTHYTRTAMDPSDNVILAHWDDSAQLASSLSEARARVQHRGGRTNVRLIRELFPRLTSSLVLAGFREVKREPLLVCTLEQFQPAGAVSGLAVVTLTSESPLEAVQQGLDVNERGFDLEYTGSATEELAATYRSTLITARAFVARLNGEISAGGMFHAPLDGVTQFSGITTLTPYRRRGIAAALTTVMVETAFDAGVDLVYLAAANEPARRVYERLGFREAGTLLVYDNAGH